MPNSDSLFTSATSHLSDRAIQHSKAHACIKWTTVDVHRHPSDLNMPAKLLALPARTEFPLADKVLYLNSSLQQPLSQTVKEAYAEMMDEHLMEPTPKQAWYIRTDELRLKMSAFIGAKKQDICFTKNTSEQTE